MARRSQRRSPRMSRRTRVVVGGVLVGALAAPVVAYAATSDGAVFGRDEPTAHRAAASAAAKSVNCTSDQAGLAEKLEKDIAGALEDRKGSVAVGVQDAATGTACSLHSDAAFDSASIVKVTVLAAVLWDAENEGRTLSDEEREQAKSMITESDNEATSALWKELGHKKVEAFLKAAGMTHTKPGEDRFWGLTRVTAEDEQKLLSHVTGDTGLLDVSARAEILELMGHVVPDQRWGTPAGAPASEQAFLKNGWLERDKGGWRVHSIGAFENDGRNYTMTVLTQGSSSFDEGVDTVEGVARAVHKDLGGQKARAAGTAVPALPAAG